MTVEPRQQPEPAAVVPGSPPGDDVPLAAAPQQGDADAFAGSGTEPKVVAAGALCWRVREGRLQVLVIHRPRYGDWSWPKGKLDAGETTPECAVREVREEVGLQIRLGVPLPSTRYLVSSGLKVVHYWAAKVERGHPEADGREVDEVRWCDPEAARGMLTNPTDRDPLDALVQAFEEGRLDSFPVIIVRHAKAKPRSSWTRAEGDRPLVATGLRQAKAVSRLLLAWRPGRVLSSPWVRCVQTVRPYVKSENPRFKTVDAVTEHNARRRPGKARAAVESLFDKGKPVVLCTHRPVLPLVFEVLASHMSAAMAEGLPKKDPYLAPGEAVICQVSRRDPSTVLSLEQYRAFDD